MAHKNEEAVKKKIVDGYKRGVCDHEGRHIDKSNRGQAGKGSHFLECTKITDAYREGWDRIWGKRKRKAS